MTDNSDPYRYGPPVPSSPQWAPAPGTRATGKQILAATWTLLRRDRQLIVLPLISGIAALIAAAVLFVPGFAIGAALGNDGAGAWIGGVLAVFAASIIGIYFQAALVLGAFWRADGHAPTVGGVLRATWTLRGPIVGWALLATTVGLAIRAAEQRLGVLGKIVGFLGGFAWAVASFLAVPALVAEGLGPIAAVKRSGQLIRSTWGTSLRTTLRFGLVQLALMIPVIGVVAVGIFLLASGSTGSAAIGAVFVVLGVLAFIGLVTVFTAITTYARAMIYRYSIGRPVPGVPDGLMGGAFMAKKRRRA